MQSFWSGRFSQGVAQIRGSVIRDLLKVTEQPDVISFAGGLPAPECFPTEELTAATERVLVERPLAALQYGPTEGFTPLREWIAAQMRRLGIAVALEQLLVTSGSQQALDLLGKLMIDPGAPVAVEEPTYVGALQAWQPYRPRFIALPLDDEGLDVAALAALLARGERPRFLYVVSSFQNPTGVTMSTARRLAVLELAARYELPIVEDDPYGELYYDQVRSAPLAALDVQMHGQLRQVVYLSTFSKQLAPGLRVGWVAAPPELIFQLVQAKQGMDLHTCSLAQATAFEVCRDGLLDRHMPFVRAVYRERRDAMLAALAEVMPPTVGWTRPGGGMFIWLTLPETVDAADVLRRALEERVAFVPGAAFHANGGGQNTLRLNFSHPAPATIYNGVERLSHVIG